MLFALLVPDPHAFAFDDDPWIIFLKGFVLDQVVPNVRAVGFDHVAEIVLGQVAVHGCRLR